MKIVADENIPLLEAFFGELGEVVTRPGRAICAEDVRNADVLLVRSVTPVNEALLSGSSVRFVGTATIGTDHLDTQWLESQGIRWASAPGCNAESVVEHVISALVYLDTFHGFEWLDKRYGVIGHGQIGSRLASTLRRLGCVVKVYDAPREAAGEGPFDSFEDVLKCDVVTLHVPLTRDGQWPTHHLIDERALQVMQPGSVLINTSRGGVVDDSALLEAIRAGRLDAVLDVFESEPQVSGELIRSVRLATPHVAGYSLDGKCQGTEMIYQALCQAVGLPVRRKLGQYLPEPVWRKVCLSEADNLREVARHLVTACHDVRLDDRALRGVLGQSGSVSAEAFDALRKHYRVRRSFRRTRLDLHGSSKRLSGALDALGFRIMND
ncbi:MAG: 4-phosphoerythronate dehydrogenase [Gammaproteobacteria bacterium]|nr:MAG: 4-phosphoerythronate dehydrogenase [Gammaproteobacteria bacterium]